MLNRLVSFKVGTNPECAYTYRADGLRVKKVTGSGTTLYRYDGQMGMQDVELDSSNAVVSVMDSALGARGVDALSKTTSSGTVVSYPLYDAHGNMVSTLSKSGSGYSYSAVRTFDAWGSVRSGGSDSRGYCANLGHKADDESGLIYMRARYYEPGTGRFISEDSSLDGTNWFCYCGNDPIGKVDSDGKSAEALKFCASMLLFIVGFLLLGGVVPDLDTKLDRIAYELRKANQVSKLDGMFADISKKGFMEAKRLEKVQAGAKAGRTIAAIIGYSMMISALIIDIDLVGSGYDMLTTLYGDR